MPSDSNTTNIPQDITQKVVVYPGNFEPFHKRHFEIYSKLVEEFGKENVYLVTGDLEEGERSQLIHEDKKLVMEKIFHIDEDHIEEVENAYIPAELLKKFNPKTTAYLTFLEPKDAIKLQKTKYFIKYEENRKLDPFLEHGYILSEEVPPIQVGNRTLTDEQVSEILQSESVKLEVKYKILEAIFPEQDESVTKLFIDKKSKSSSSEKSTSDASDKESSSKAGDDKSSEGEKGKDTPELKGGKNKPIMQRLIKNPESDRYIKIQSALKYPRWKPVYKMANQVLKVAGIDRTDRVKEPEVNTRYKKRAAKINKEDIAIDLTNQLNEEIMKVISVDGLTIHFDKYGTINLKGVINE